MTECQSCNSKLETEGLQPGQRYRCANCEAVHLFGTTEKVPADKLAWRSLWLGLASIILVFITGIPAIYYGIKSLLRMRFVKSKKSDRAAAIAGTALGGCFGLFFGFIVVSIISIGLLSYLTYKTTSVPSEVVENCEQIFDFEAPPEFKPIEAQEMLGMQKSFDFADDIDEEKRHARIYLKFLGSSMRTNEDGLIGSLSSKSVNNGLGEERETELLKWNVFGEDTDVRKTIFEPSTEDSNIVETHQYFVLVRRRDGYYGMTIVYEPECFELNEGDVRAIFEGVRVAGDVAANETKVSVDSE